MKNLSIKIALILSVSISEFSLSQTYNGAFHERFFGAHPGASIEAMGRSGVSIPGEQNSYFFNPAGLAALNGMNINGGGISTSRYDHFSDASMGYGAASWKFRKLSTIGLSVEVFNTGEYIIKYKNKNGDSVSAKFNNYVNNYRLTVCSEIIKDLYAGINLNFLTPDRDFGYMLHEHGNLSGPYLYFDLGILKSFKFGRKNLKQDLNIGASIVNVNAAGYNYSDGTGEGKLPVILRTGTSYNILINETFNFLLNAEYEDLLNSENYDGLHTGFEFSLDPLLYLRTGYYSQDIPDKDFHSQFTYGIGVNILFPVYFTGMESMPGFKIIFDYSHLSLPNFVKNLNEKNRSDMYSVTFTKWF